MIVARPYALAIAYLIPMLILAVVGWRRFRPITWPRTILVATLLVALVVDYACTLTFTDRSLKLY